MYFTIFCYTYLKVFRLIPIASGVILESHPYFESTPARLIRFENAS